jgi:hypothetical protein
MLKELPAGAEIVRSTGPGGVEYVSIKIGNLYVDHFAKHYDAVADEQKWERIIAPSIKALESRLLTETKTDERPPF